MTYQFADQLSRAAKWLLFGGTLCVVLVVGAYVIVLAPSSGYSLSRSDGVWANFGTYVGGMLGPVFAFLAFVGVLATVWLQVQQLQHLKSQAHLEELQRVIATVSKSIDDLLVQPAGPATGQSFSQNSERTVFVMLSAAGTAALTAMRNNLDATLLASNNTVINVAKDSLLLQSNSLLIELQQLVWCLEEYEQNSGSQTVAKFYKNRYAAVVCWLDAINLANSSARVQKYFDPRSHRQFMVREP